MDLPRFARHRKVVWLSLLPPFVSDGPFRGPLPERGPRGNITKSDCSTNDLSEYEGYSSDRDGEAFKEYFVQQPWFALEYSDRKRKDQLNSWCKVGGIPSFVVFDKDVTLITLDGRAAVSGDPTGDEFPWYPKPVGDLKGCPGDINKVTTVFPFVRFVRC